MGRWGEDTAVSPWSRMRVLYPGRVDAPCEQRSPGPGAPMLAQAVGRGGGQRRRTDRQERGNADGAGKGSAGWTSKMLRVYSPNRGREEGQVGRALDKVLAIQCGGTTCSGPHGLEAGEEAEQQGDGHHRAAAPGAAGPAARGVLPGREVAEGGLAAGHSHQGPLQCLGEGVTRVCTPYGVGGQRP